MRSEEWGVWSKVRERGQGTQKCELRARALHKNEGTENERRENEQERTRRISVELIKHRVTTPLTITAIIRGW